MDQQAHLVSLIRILKFAYSGELAAAYAYQGHANSVHDAGERERIQTIEAEEWHHRDLVGGMLRDLKSGPDRWKEIKAHLIGRIIGLLCHVTGWLAPMYGAGKLESRNIKEYEAAARYARDCGRTEFVDGLLGMAEVEWEHERYFRSQVVKHAWGRRIPLWSPPPPKENIRGSYENENV